MELVTITKMAYVTTDGRKFVPISNPLPVGKMPYSWRHIKAQFKEHFTHRLYQDYDNNYYITHCPVNSQWDFYCRVIEVN